MSPFLPFVLPIAVWVAWSDMARMKIPNKAVIALFGIFVVLGLVGLTFETYLWRYVQFAAVLMITFILNMVRAMATAGMTWMSRPLASASGRAVSMLRWVAGV